MSDFRHASRTNWASSNSVEHINAGSLQRIADAAEKMAQRHTELIRDRDNYERYYRSECASHNMTRLQLRASKGVITKLRKQLAEARAAAQGVNDE
jgi:hypothetical protein